MMMRKCESFHIELASKGKAVETRACVINVRGNPEDTGKFVRQLGLLVGDYQSKAVAEWFVGRYQSGEILGYRQSRRGMIWAVLEGGRFQETEARATKSALAILRRGKVPCFKVLPSSAPSSAGDTVDEVLPLPGGPS
jgi:hypothetical protein